MIHVERSKGGRVSTHTMDKDERNDLRKLRAEDPGRLYVFETERGTPLSTQGLEYIVGKRGARLGSTSTSSRTCSVTAQAIAWPIRASIPD